VPSSARTNPNPLSASRRLMVPFTGASTFLWSSDAISRPRQTTTTTSRGGTSREEIHLVPPHSPLLRQLRRLVGCRLVYSAAADSAAKHDPRGGRSRATGGAFGGKRAECGRGPRLRHATPDPFPANGTCRTIEPTIT
jgi:hypothetical protein